MNGNKIVIKKYENRRLYDTTNSRYVNLGEVAGMIRRGMEVQVLDARTGQDLTRLILTQIIVEDAKEREFALPLDVLRQMVLASGKASQEMLAQYMKAASDFFQNAYQTIGSPAGPLELMRAMFAPAAARWPFGAPPQPVPEAKPPDAEHSAPLSQDEQTELNLLRRRVEELERRFEESNRTARPKNAPKQP